MSIENSPRGPCEVHDKFISTKTYRFGQPKIQKRLRDPKRYNHEYCLSVIKSVRVKFAEWYGFVLSTRPRGRNNDVGNIWKCVKCRERFNVLSFDRLFGPLRKKNKIPDTTAMTRQTICRSALFFRRDSGTKTKKEQKAKHWKYQSSKTTIERSLVVSPSCQPGIEKKQSLHLSWVSVCKLI